MITVLAMFLGLSFSQNLAAAIMVVLHSFWVPQIKRNVSKGTRKALRKRYIFGATLGRCYFVLCEWPLLWLTVFELTFGPTDAYACPRNVLFNETDSKYHLVQFCYSTFSSFLGSQGVVSGGMDDHPMLGSGGSGVHWLCILPSQICKLSILWFSTNS